MNNTFDLTRFGMLLVKDFRTMIKQYGVSLLVIVALPILTLMLDVVLHNYHSEWAPEARLGIMGALLALTVSIAPSKIYHNINRGNAGIYFATLPASKLEKYLSMMIICLLVVPVIYLAGAFVVDCLLTALPWGGYNHWLWQDNTLLQALPAMSHEAAKMGVHHWNTATIIDMLVISYLSTALFFMLTGTFFKTHKWVKSVLTLIALNFVLSLIELPLIPDATEFVGRIFAEDITKVDTLSVWGQVIGWIINAGLAVWIYFRMKKMKY